jgi:hypothetical protein
VVQTTAFRRRALQVAVQSAAKRFRRGFIPRQLNLPALAGKSLSCVRPIPLSSVRFWLDRQVYEFMDSKNKINRYLFYVLKPFFEVFLWSLDKLFEITRKRVEPTYPYNRETRKINLPKNIENEIYQMAIKLDKPKAIKKVTELTGAGLRVSKDYVDNLLMNTGTGYKVKGTKT